MKSSLNADGQRLVSGWREKWCKVEVANEMHSNYHVIAIL